jgi:hypothetical protein
MESHNQPTFKWILSVQSPKYKTKTLADLQKMFNEKSEIFISSATDEQIESDLLDLHKEIQIRFIQQDYWLYLKKKNK